MPANDQPAIRHYRISLALVLGSEGRFGILTEAAVRVVATPRVEAIPSWFLPDWPRAIEAARDIARAGLSLSMARLSTPIETATLLALAGGGRGVGPLRAYLGFRKIEPEPCLLLVAATGNEKLVEEAKRGDAVEKWSHTSPLKPAFYTKVQSK